MLELADDPRAVLRRGVYWLLIAISTGAMLGRILAVNSVDNVRLEKYLQDQDKKKPAKPPERRLQRPFFSGNDRSRWCTVRALVEHRTFAIDRVIQEPNWDTIDMVKHDDRGQAAPKADEGHLYSSKPTLLPTLMAAEYWAIHKLTGATLGTHPYEIGRFMLVTINVVPLVVYFWLLWRIFECMGTTDWGRVFAFGCATFGTFITTFAIVINNHLIAAVSAMVALYAACRIWYDGERRLRYFAVAGLAAAFTFANELPALSFFGLLSLGLLLKTPKQTLLAYVPASLLVVAGILITNYAAHGILLPAYSQRGEENNWYKYQYVRDGKVRDSYWTAPDNPIDQGEASPGVYAFHALIGHHGIFSLTPVWLFSLMGVVLMIREPRFRALGWLIAITSLVCLVFYTCLLGQKDRNYGGMSSGFRWVFWFAPMWLTGMLPALDRMAGCRGCRGFALVLLAMSVLSASYPTWNPWVHPWLFNWLTYLGWVRLGP